MATTGKIEFYGGYQVYSETGVDLTMLRENLRRPLEERLEANRRAATFAQALRRAALRAGGTVTETQDEETMFDAAALIRQLTAHRVDFVLIGGLAMIALGATFVTQDVGVCYGRSPANLAALVAALAPIHPHLRGAPPGLPFRFDVPTLQAGLNFTLVTDHGDLDLLGEVSGIGPYEEALAQSDALDVSGVTVRVLSLDGLIAAKTAAGRAKDQGHLLELVELKKLRDASAPPGES
jgi:predicted nucleotidyltransferase